MSRITRFFRNIFASENRVTILFWQLSCVFLGTSQCASTKTMKSTKSQYLWEGRRATRSNKEMFGLCRWEYLTKNSMNKKSIIHLVTKTNEDATKVLFSCSMFAVKLCDTRALFIFCIYIYDISTHALGLFMSVFDEWVSNDEMWEEDKYRDQTKPQRHGVEITHVAL